jgi:hypothetical protein
MPFHGATADGVKSVGGGDRKEGGADVELLVEAVCCCECCVVAVIVSSTVAFIGGTLGVVEAVQALRV